MVELSGTHTFILLSESVILTQFMRLKFRDFLLFTLRIRDNEYQYYYTFKEPFSSFYSEVFLLIYNLKKI